MNAWKTIAILSTSALVAVVGQQVASASFSGSTGGSVNGGDYRQMRAALDNLREARHHFENSEHNHGGWRERALESTDRAIKETEAALSWNP